MRRALLVLLALCGPAHAQGLVSNPLLFPSASLTAGNCIQATGPNTIATIAGPCGTATGSGNVSGPTSATVGDIAVFSNGTGTGIADSHVMAASIPFLGANNTWGGFNTFMSRPVWDLGGTIATPWDDNNLPSPLTTTVAASTYLTIADAAAQYLTQADAATTYLTITDAAAQYLTIANAAATYLTPAAATAKYMPFAGGTFTGQVTFGASQSIAIAGTGPFTGTHYTTNNVLRFNVGVDTAEAGNNTGSNLHFYVYNDAGVFQGDAMTVTRSTLAASFLNRPSWAGFTPWDSGNFNPANYLTTAAAAATYTTPAEVNTALAGFRTIGNVTFNNQTSGNSNVQSLFAQSGDGHNFVFLYPEVTAGNAPAGVPASALSTVAQAADAALMTSIANLGLGGFTIGMNGQVGSPSAAAIRFATLTAGGASIALGVRPTFGGFLAWDAGNFNPANFQPVGGVGLPYDLSITYQGSSTPTTPYTAGTRILQYVFTRKVVFPAGFAGSRVDCLHAPATTSQQITLVSSALGGLGGVTFTAGSTAGTFTNQPGGTMTFNPGDILTVTTATTSPTPDVALAGIYGTLQGAISP